jgi:hypothetical protein
MASHETVMATAQTASTHILRQLADLMLAVSGESVSVMKRSAPEQAMSLKKQQEWKIYLEFLKILFNLVDRLAAFHLPIQERPHFMDSLEETVARRLHDVLAPAMGAEADEMELKLSVGNTVAESRQTYERFAFMPTEASKARDEYFRLLGDRVAQLLKAAGNEVVVSSASVCASAAIPAIEAVFKSLGQPADTPAAASRGPTIGNEIKLVSVMSSVTGEEVETRWGFHPRFRQDLKPEEMQELAKLINRVTRIVGERYAAVAFSADWASWHQGNA